MMRGGSSWSRAFSSSVRPSVWSAPRVSSGRPRGSLDQAVPLISITTCATCAPRVICSWSRSPGPSAITATGRVGRSGDADIKPAPVPATTDHRPPGNREDHDLRLEYQPQHFWWRRGCGLGPPMAAGSRDGAARPCHLDQDGAGQLCWRRSARETGGAVGLGRIVARAGGLPAGVPPRGELTAFVAASHLARSVTRSKGRRWREE
jgi:hypothetical protein